MESSRNLGVSLLILTGSLLSAGPVAAEPSPRAEPPTTSVAAAARPSNDAEGETIVARKRHDYRPGVADIIDYTLIPAAVVAGGLLVTFATPNPDALIGPSYDPDLPTFTSREATRIGKPHRIIDTVPIEWTFAAAGALTAGLAAIGVYDGLASGWSERRELNDLLVGYSEALAFTFLTTEVGKVAFGRLRPDFLGRLQRYEACAKRGSAGACADARADAFEEGRASFPSGHTSFSFAMANYTALAIGGRFVWGDRRTPVLAPLGAAAQIGLFGLATWVGVSRVDDGRHNPSDVMAGMAVGLLWSNVAYWRRFDARGRPRRAAPRTIDVTPGPGDVGAAIHVTF